MDFEEKKIVKVENKDLQTTNDFDVSNLINYINWKLNYYEDKSLFFCEHYIKTIYSLKKITNLTKRNQLIPKLSNDELLKIELDIVKRKREIRIKTLKLLDKLDWIDYKQNYTDK